MPRPLAAAVLAMTALLALTCGHASAATPAQRCAAIKRKAAALATKGFGVCDAKAVLRGVSVDAACVAKVRSVFTKVWTRAERKPGCAPQVSKVAVEDRIDAHDADMQARLGLSGPASKCSSLKFREAGRRGACRLSCSVKAAKAGVTLSDVAIARCTARCSSKLIKGFGRAEAKPACHTTGDAAAIDSALGAFVDCITGLVGINDSTPCGGSSSTTSLPASTSTTSSPTPTTTTMSGASTTTTPTTSTTTTSGPAVTQCCLPTSSPVGSFICMTESPAACAGDGGIDVGPGSCVPDPCSGITATSTTSPTTTTTPTTTPTTTTGPTTTSTPTTSTTSTSGPALTQCCLPTSSPVGSFICMTESPADCILDSGIDVGPGSCTPDPCLTIPSTTLPTTSTSSTTISSTTSTTGTTLVACGGIEPLCLGSCPPGEVCQGGALLADCVCTPITIPTTTTTFAGATTTTSAGATTSTTLFPCGGIAPVCLGSCPFPQICMGAPLAPCTCQ